MNESEYGKDKVTQYVVRVESENNQNTEYVLYSGDTAQRKMHQLLGYGQCAWMEIRVVYDDIPF